MMSRSYTASKTIDFFGSVEAHYSFNVHPAEKPVYWGDAPHPGSPAFVEDVSVRLTDENGADLPCPEWLQDLLVGEDGLDDWLLEEAAEADLTNYEAAAEMKAEMLREAAIFCKGTENE